MTIRCHLTMRGSISPPTALPSTLDVKLTGAELAFLRKLEAAGGRVFVDADQDRKHAQACARQWLCVPSQRDRQCFSITAKGRAYVARLRAAI